MTKFLLLVSVLISAGYFPATGQKKIPVERLKITHPQSNSKQPAKSTAFKNKGGIGQHDISPACDSIFISSQSEIDNFSATHPDCDTIRVLTINGLDASPAITNLNGLNGLVAITGNLTISNTSVTNLGGLSGLHFIGETLQLDHNASLESIGLNDLTKLGRIVLRGLPSLTDISGLSDNISSIGSVIIDSTALTSLDGLEGIVNIEEFDGLMISSSPLISLSSLSNLTTIQGYIRLDNMPQMTHIGLNTLEQTYGFLFSNMLNLTSLEGLTTHLTNTSIGTFWFISTGITSLSGLANLSSSSNFYLWFNPNLNSLNGLEGLTGNIGGGIFIWSNEHLTDITALSNITSISDGTLEIRANNSLLDATGINNITTIGGGLWINENPLLTSLDFLNSNLIIQNNNDDLVKIMQNEQLALCSSTPLCNYLGAGGSAIIENNAPGCSSISEILASCNNCTNGQLKTWTGDQSSDWDDPDNWSPMGVPGSCDTVFIPEGMFNYPVLNSNITIRGLIMDQYTNLDLRNFSLINNGVLTINNAQIYSDNNGNSIHLRNAIDPFIENSTLTASEIFMVGYKGTLTLNYNTFNGNVEIADSAGRQGANRINGNYFYGNLVLTTNSEESGAETIIGDDGETEVTGSVTFNINAPVRFGGGATYRLKIHEDLNVNTNVDPYYVDLNAISFTGGSYSHIRQLGTTPITIQNLYTEKYSPHAYIIPDHNISIINNVEFYIGIIKTTATSLLIFNESAGINQTSSASWIWGPAKKIGNTQFTFPIGDSLRQAILTILSPPLPTDAYTAQYFHKNPSVAGYDTALHQPSVSRISGAEYWILNKDAGSSNVFVSLSYDSTRSHKTLSLYSLRTSQWNGSQWENKGAIFLSGNLFQATLTSAGAITSYGQPLTLSYIEPPIIPIITIGNMDTVTCRGSGLKVRYTLDTLMFSGNDFSIQLSDSSGSFATPTTLGVLVDKTQSDSITVSIPVNTKLSELYKIRIVGNSPPDTSINTRPLAIRTAPSVAFTIQGPQPGCIGSGIHKYYASQKEEGVTYNWTLSGGGTFTSNQDTAYVTWTTVGTHTISLSTSNLCGNGPSANRQINVGNPAPTATPSLNKIGRWLYASEPEAAQHAAGYHWYRNDSLISGANNSSFYAIAGGTYKVSYYNLCGDGPASTIFVYSANSVPQTIDFPVVSPKIYGDSAFVINTSASSGFPVSLSIVSGPGTLSGNVYSITNSGTVTIKAIQQGDDVYDTAAYVLQSFVINKAIQTINFPVIAESTPVTPAFVLNAISSSNLPVSYALISGPATISGNQLTITGAGTVLLAASQAGDTNYLPATVVNQSFCVRVPELASISGALYACPSQTATYKINRIAGMTYSWRLSNGTIFPSTNDSVVITWNSSGTYTLIVSATGPCGAASANDSLVVNVITPVAPGVVSNMLPENGATGQQLPLTLSWIPGTNALTYDVYIWDSATAQPSLPFVSNITTVSYSIANGSFPYNKTYKWRVVSHNACLQADGPVQTFRLRPLPDLLVSNVQLPATATSGQTISLSWRVTNLGPGNTTTNQSWTDAVFLSFDTIPVFNIPPNTNPGGWSLLDFPVRPLLVATKPNVSALDSGQHYDNNVSFTLPLNYAQPLYLYVITNYPTNGNAPFQMTYANDTARAPQPVNVTLAPTPDLRVDTIFTPASVFSGSTVNITYKVKNYGSLTPPGNTWADKIYISQNSTFNINTAIQLTLPKANGSYYPNAAPATINHNTQVQADSSYTKSIQAVLPNFISGTYYVFVATNQTGTLYEGLLSTNNNNKAQLQVFLTPTPQLTVGSVNVPVTQASITQPIGVNWTILNTGFNDNIEKNKGHYYLQNGTCTNNSLVKLIDSIGFGSSYWIDRVYLSTDPSGINSNAILIGSYTQGVLNSGQNSDLALPEKCASPGTDLSSYNENTSNVIRPASSHPGQLNFIIPDNLLPGNYYVYVRANATQTVFEYPGTIQVRRSDLPISIQRPDVTVSAVNIPASVTGGQQFTIQYTVVNNGAGTVFNHQRKDRIFISASSVFDGSAELIATQTFTETLPVASQVAHSLNYTFAASANGTKYIYVQTNYDSSFRETSYSNNISSASILVSSATPVDWVVSSVTLPDTVFTVFPSLIKYEVNNNGIGNAIGSWTDSIFISCSPSFNNATAYFIASRIQSGTINSGAGYTDSFALNLPMSWFINNCFPQSQYSTAYFFVKSNANHAIFEGSNGNNNITSSGAKVLVNPLVDHIVSAINAGDTATVARPYTLTWSVKNLGHLPTTQTYHSWADAVYFSPDSVFNANAVLANTYTENTRLGTNQVYSETKNIIPPNLVTGDYYVFVITNVYNQIVAEKIITNNSSLLRNSSGIPKKIHVIQPLLPDLVDSILTAPALAAIGQPITVVHKVTNAGTGVTYPNTWSNDIWLSQDFIPGNSGDIKLSSRNFSGLLQAGQFKTDTVTATLSPNIAPGNYILLVKTDAGNGMVESNDTNNVAFRFLTIYSPAPSDLVVENITNPDTATLGYPLNAVQWEVSNSSVNNATGLSSDGVYLSRNTTLDSSAVLIGVVGKYINISPLGQNTATLQPMVTGVIEGNYNLLVKTDLLNNIIETNKNNNTGIASAKVYVRVNELKLNVPENNTVQNNTRYYKLIIPDSLAGATVRVSLTSNDSLTMRNEMFISKGYVPTPAQYDYRFETPNYGNQHIVITSVEDSVYYIAIRCVSANPVVQNITLNAVKLPFAILMVQSNSGGNSGNVTVKISGSLFVPGMTAKLSNAGATIYSSAVYYSNSTSVFATFNLKDKALGIYDLTLQKPDSATALLAGSFSVVAPGNGGFTGGGVNTGSNGSGNDPGCDPGAPAGLNSQLITEVIIPKKVFAGWPFVIQVNYTNPTNTDLPSQIRILYNDLKVPIATNQAGLVTGTASLYLELIEPGGPPGIIRAGATGTILVYAKAPLSTPGHSFINFILK